MSKMMTQIFRPKFVLMTIALIACFGQHMSSASPLPDDTTNIKGQVSDFVERAKNTFTPEKDSKGEKLTSWEIAGIIAGGVVVFFILLCCIGYCLCECVKELICCICCCCRD